jgi:hypothetical protein
MEAAPEKYLEMSLVKGCWIGVHADLTVSPISPRTKRDVYQY